MVKVRFSPLVYLFMRIIIFAISSFFCGYGVLVCFSWANFIIPEQLRLVIGFFVVGLYFISNKVIKRYMGFKAYKMFYPLTDEKISKYRFLYLNNIDAEILYLQQAINLLEHDNNYCVWLSRKISRLQSIRNKLKNNNNLNKLDMDFMNKFFPANYYLKNKSGVPQKRIQE